MFDLAKHPNAPLAKADKKPVVRRRPGGMKPEPASEKPAPHAFGPMAPKANSSHDRYLTTDVKGRLITATVYHAPRTAVILRQGKPTKKQLQSSTEMP